MKISFIHTGDIHLGRQFHFTERGEEFGTQTRNDLWRVFGKIINTAEKNAIDFLLIAGDLFDTAEIDIGEIKRAAQKMGQLTKTQVIILPGNHDYYSENQLYGIIKWPENVSIFKSDTMEEYYFPEKQTRIFGIGWLKDTYSEMPEHSGYRLREEDNNILLLHGDAYHSKSELMPIDISDFDNFDYIALGHIHKNDFRSKRAAYCGCPQPLSFKDSGDHGIIVGQIENHRCEANFVSTQIHSFVTSDIKINPEMTVDDVRESCLKIAPEKERINNYYRIRLSGYRDLAFSTDLLRSELVHLFYYVEVDDSDLQPDWDIDKIYENNKDNVIGRFIQEMRRNTADEAIAEKALYYGLEGLLKNGGKE